MEFNQDQEAAANAINGVYVVVSGPGSGKTTVLIERHLRMLMSGINQADILNLTFTNAAADEMAKRAGLLKSESIFRTFHSFAIELLKKERDKLDFDLCDTVIPVGAEDYQLLFDLVRLYPGINFRTLKEKIETWKCQNILPGQAVEETRHTAIEHLYAWAYREYEEKCRERGWLDFDSLMREAVNLLEDNEEVRNRWKRKYIGVDEAQDCDVTQFRMLQLIFDGNIFAVGDENQLIYEWRSAQSNNLSNFEKHFPGAKKLYLGQNYRSTSALVNFFKEIIPVDNGIASRMMTVNPLGIEPTITRYIDDEKEAFDILKRKITEPEKTAVIARTNRQLFIFQRMCATYGIKYKILGKKDFFEQNEVKKLLHLAKESKDFRRPAVDVLRDLIVKHRFLEIYKGAGHPTEGDPIENINSIVKMANGKGTIPEFLDKLRKLTHARKNIKGLTLSTVHQSKGREYDHVYLVGVSQGRMPHKDGELNEEKRIFFVAASRAAKTLNISFYEKPSMFLNDYLDKIVNKSFKEEECPSYI